MQVSFRRAAFADIDQLVEFVRRFYAIDHYTFEERQVRRTIADLIGHEDLGGIWLIEQDGQPAGYLMMGFSYSLEFHGRNAVVDELYVDDAWRGYGIGKQAIQFAIGIARELKLRALHLEVERTNMVAQKLYSQYGFQDNGRLLWTLRLGE
jgi:ribosomal protein S18 acetylase RimI-like enzyme